MISKTLDTRELRRKEQELRVKFNRAIKVIEALELGEVGANMINAISIQYSDRLKAIITDHISSPSVAAEPSLAHQVAADPMDF